MKRMKLIVYCVFLVITTTTAQNSWIRINQLGYQEEAIKVAVFASNEKVKINSFEVKTSNDEVVYKSGDIKSYGEFACFKSTYRLDFSGVKKHGEYYIVSEGIKSPTFRIDDNVYDGTADFLLNYMRQQRCGYNPFFKDSCHTHDGFVVDNPENNSAYVDVKGGWHDASDYLQYLTTSANATYQMLFAYYKNPSSFRDDYDKNGNKCANGIPDILDEAKWGLDWLVKMNPEYGVMYNQIADDRDHAGYRLPTKDSVDYGKGFERPVYLITGKVQGLSKYKNRTTGVSSSAAKFASAFSLGGKLLKKHYPEFSKKILVKAEEAYKYAKSDIGVTQTASYKAPYFYEEGNYVDDMELAAVQLFNITNNDYYLKEAVYWGKVEPFTPWMGADTARHYQWYPFVNLGHYHLSIVDDKKTSKLFKGNLRKGLENIYKKGKDNAFQFGIPFIWCSNNLVAAALTQAGLFEEVTGSKKYAEMEAALKDWLFGCNPWGTSMIVGLPKDGDTPTHPHSSLTVLHNYETTGGLVDGPVYGNIFKSLLGLKLDDEDEYGQFQSNLVVYHDDFGDYSTNEPTMDGTASLSYYLSKLEAGKKKVETNHGAIIRGNVNDKSIYLTFTGHDFNDGNDIVFKELSKNNIKANFFFTGDFFRNKENKDFINKLISEGNFVGAHSDKHLLYAPWENRDSLLVTKDEFIIDLLNNYKEMNSFGLTKKNVKVFLPPFEWYNKSIAKWTEELGLKLVSFSYGTKSTADYTFPSLGERYRTSDEIFKSIIDYEESSENGLNGFHLLLHVGADAERTDKFYFRLSELIDILMIRGYKFKLYTDYH